MLSKTWWTYCCIPYYWSHTSLMLSIKLAFVLMYTMLKMTTVMNLMPAWSCQGKYVTLPVGKADHTLSANVIHTIFFCSSPQCLDRALLVVVLVVHHCLCLPLLPCCNSFFIHRFGALWMVKQLLRFKCTCCVKKIVDAAQLVRTNNNNNNKKNGVYGSSFFSSQQLDFIVLLYEIFY